MSAECPASPISISAVQLGSAYPQQREDRPVAARGVTFFSRAEAGKRKSLVHIAACAKWGRLFRACVSRESRKVKPEKSTEYISFEPRIDIRLSRAGESR